MNAKSSTPSIFREINSAHRIADAARFPRNSLCSSCQIPPRKEPETYGERLAGQALATKGGPGLRRSRDPGIVSGASSSIDLRGRGKSEGERFFVGTFDDYVADLHAVVTLAKSREPAVPLFVLGHSAGGIICCLYTLDHDGEVAGLICEDFAFEVPAPDFALGVLKGISHVVPHAHSLRLKNADFSRDVEVIGAMNGDPLIAGEAQPFATAAALVRADERLKREFSNIKTPALIIHGTADKAAKASGSQHFYERVGSQDKTLKLYEGRYHDPLNDIGREKVMSDILSWIGQRIV
jgi:alpha-beta hydrolase superfamily lysophospholipase